MKRIMDALRSARKIEILIIVAMVCTLLVLEMNSDSSEISGSSQEARLQQLLSLVKGAGKVHVMISDDGSGAVVAAEGADDVRVMLEIQRAVRAITGLELERIEIVKSGR